MVIGDTRIDQITILATLRLFVWFGNENNFI